jgi:hypothetical protein
MPERHVEDPPVVPLETDVTRQNRNKTAINEQPQRSDPQVGSPYLLSIHTANCLQPSVSMSRATTAGYCVPLADFGLNEKSYTDLTVSRAEAQASVKGVSGERGVKLCSRPAAGMMRWACRSF